MKILLVSDTHGKDQQLEQAIFAEAPFDALIHCGDVEGSEYYIEAIAECPCTFVSGNNDFFSDLPREEIVDLAGTRVLVTHGHYYGVSLESLAGAARAKGCQAVFFGHTHRPMIEEVDGILAVNPGSLSYPRQQGRKPTYIVIEAQEGCPLSLELRSLPGGRDRRKQ